MTEAAPIQTAAMQGDGFYNRNSSLQAANITTALPLLAEVARSIAPDGAGPVTIVDYGASQGRNSMVPMRTAIDAIRATVGDDRPIEIVHTDLPSNDFQSLFTLLADDPSSYLADRPNVFPSAIGRSYFGPILPPGRVDLGWSSNALHWLSRNPADVADHGWAVFSASPAARDAVDAVLAQDWADFLRARGPELRPGAKLVCQFLGRGAEHHGFEWMSGAWWQSIVDMARDGLVSDAELLRMTCPSAGRSVAQVEAPFVGGAFAGLTIAHLSVVETPDTFWDTYVRTGDAVALGRTWATVMRAANGPNFVGGLNADRDREAFLDELTERLAARITRDPQRSQAYLLIVVLEKVAG